MRIEQGAAIPAEAMAGLPGRATIRTSTHSSSLSTILVLQFSSTRSICPDNVRRHGRAGIFLLDDSSD
jgi:hypothetical protein